jgi:hypothetical protein
MRVHNTDFNLSLKMPISSFENIEELIVAHLSSVQMAMPCGLLFLMSLVRVAVSSSFPTRSRSCHAFLHTTPTHQQAC